MSARWWSARAIALHITALVVIVAFALLARWQIHRAVSGNTLSWAYAFEWPFFALYAVYMWWRLLHEDEPRRDRRPEDPRVEEERAAYNRYLQSLADGTSHRR